MKKQNQQEKEKLKPAKSVNADILVPRIAFILSTLALVLFGLVMVFSASSVEAIGNNDSPYSFLLKQLGFCLAGIIGAVIIWRKIPFSFWRGKATWYAFGFMFILMFATLLTGKDALGARRWIMIGPMSLQPSEFVKIALILLVSKLYAEFYVGIIDVKTFITRCALSVFLLLAFIVVAQSDLGTTIICVVGVIAVFWLADAPIHVVIGMIVVVAGLAIFFIMFSSYRSNRMIFLDPYNDGKGGYGAGYQLIRSMYAFSEGGLFGVGLGNSYEKFQYLPEAETDFIFAIIGEELGLVGALFIIGLFIVFLVSGLKIAQHSKTSFGTGVSGAFVIMIVFQAFLNILCVIGFAPTTGKPLPFISSGGSSLVASLFMAGFILASSEEESLPDIYEKRRQSFRAVQTNVVSPASQTTSTAFSPKFNKVTNEKSKFSFKKIINSVKENKTSSEKKSAVKNPKENKEKTRSLVNNANRKQTTNKNDRSASYTNYQYKVSTRKPLSQSRTRTNISENSRSRTGVKKNNNIDNRLNTNRDTYTMQNSRYRSRLNSRMSATEDSKSKNKRTIAFNKSSFLQNNSRNNTRYNSNAKKMSNKTMDKPRPRVNDAFKPPRPNISSSSNNNSSNRISTPAFLKNNNKRRNKR